MRFKIIIASFLIIAIYCQQAQSRRIEPLADEHTVLYKTENPENTYVYDPGIAVCPNGRLIGCFSLGGSGATDVEKAAQGGRGFVYTSDDDGDSWVHRANFDLVHFRPFVAGERLYILGHRRNLGILASDDWGDTWSRTYPLTLGEAWHGSATNVWYKDDYVYLVMEKYARDDMGGGWRVSEIAPVLMRGNVNSDLTKKENWTFASEMVFSNVVNDKELDWFGAPFYEAYYPDVKRRIRGNSSFFPMGWLEANVVQITDPKHYWYDPDGNTFHIFMRAHAGVTNIGCVIKAVEQEDGTIKTVFQKAPSGKRHLYVPLPGGHLKFSVVYDDKTQLYWMVGTQSTDSMTKPNLLPDDRYHLSYNERRRLVLHYSKNMIDWIFAGVVAIGPAESAARHYCQMVIKDDDLLIMSRSGDLDAKDAHNGNLATFHRVRDFRELVY